MTTALRFCRRVVAIAVLTGVASAPARADELWVAPTYQQDLGGLGIGSNVVWPVTPIGAVRLAWAVPNDVASFQSAKLALIPHAPGGAAMLNVIVCAAETGDPVGGACEAPVAVPFVGTPNQLAEVDISAIVGPKIGTPGANYLAVLAYTTPTTVSDHIVGLRFMYASGDNTPVGMVAFFAAGACPSGWTQYASAGGRVIVGLPSGGTAEGTVGAALANLTLRTTTDVASHSHLVDPPAATTSNTGLHPHSVYVATPGFSSTHLVGSPSGAPTTALTSFEGAHTHSVNIAAFSSAATGVPAVDVTMPYVQLMACRKS